MRHHIFLSYSTRDREQAERICSRIEESGLRCWIAERDVEPGDNYQAAIVQAIQTAKVFVLVFSGHSNDSPEVHKEVSLASAFRSVVIPLRIADTVPRGALAYELATRQWIDAFAVWDGALDHLIARARRAVDGEPGAPASPDHPPEPAAPLEAARPAIPGEELEAARAILALYVGPIAEVLVRKAAAGASSVADLHERLTAKLAHPQEQLAFRKKLERRQRQSSTA